MVLSIHFPDLRSLLIYQPRKFKCFRAAPLLLFYSMRCYLPPRSSALCPQARPGYCNRMFPQRAIAKGSPAVFYLLIHQNSLRRASLLMNVHAGRVARMIARAG